MRPAAPFTLAAFPMLLGLFSLACGGGGSSTANGGSSPATPTLACPLPNPIATPYFRTDIYPALQLSCGTDTSGCHGKANPPAGHVRYDATAREVYDSLINRPPSEPPSGWVFVQPGDPAKSWIIEKLTATSPGGGYGQRMPYGAPNLCQASIDAFKAWIQAGAKFEP